MAEEAATAPLTVTHGDTVRARPGGGYAAFAFSIGNQFSMALLYGRAGRLTTQNGGCRPAQHCENFLFPADPAEAVTAPPRDSGPQKHTVFGA